ncbi:MULTISPECIES: branched-chain amino acid ABC transporter permease [unclassified Simplicispira]|jgi:branched-chain amino acid transport system permease protein|uniref:branched-chain amino acid ABC transporter permease n=1 Tax=unclassified Simplicispira TaxID=2630407 RepID=UPI000D5DA4CE|nr:MULTISPECIES: branched-chain amino acid ABC transporter permease [unclassified Simplicispira]MDP2769970.1 branched-chain amino acid ABC transporter permease [Giesbergeria sp.]PVY54877.1 amino acid/amide ABC transporter membrane protein 1 (HAAT family) [Simplicispira sp. 125]REG15819.1 amino acid/amide ABC transporter membrane protein 1 (HAAT family) [Simplicispira sp. 110]
MLTINLFNGLVYGALLIVMSSGLALIYGLRRVVNFAHGALYMLGAYIGFSVAQHSNFWVALLVVPLVMAGVGVLLDRYGFRLLQDREPLNVMLVTFGLLLILEDLVVFIWGKANLSLFTPELLNFSVNLWGNEVPAYRIGVIVVGAAVALGLTLWLRFSRIGLFVRAASTDPVTTSMQGVNTDALSAGVVGLGSALAGLAGVVAGPFLSLSPHMSSDVLIDSFVVVVIGGLGSLAGAFIAALLLGMMQAVGAVYLPEVSVLLPFIFMIAILVWKPSGLAGSRT